MSEEALSITSERRGNTHRVAPSGELDIATVDQLERALITVEQSDAETIVLDLSGLTFIDSTGLRLVLDVNDRCGGSADRLRVIAGSPAVERLLDIVGLRERLPLITPDGPGNAAADPRRGGGLSMSVGERIGVNEAAFRDVNERIESGHWPGEEEPIAFRCECAIPGCNALIELRLPAYEGVRADPRHFALVPGHEIEGAEVVIERHPGYVVVEKIGEAGQVAKERDQRNA